MRRSIFWSVVGHCLSGGAAVWKLSRCCLVPLPTGGGNKRRDAHRRAQAGDLAAYDAVVRRFQDMAVGYAYSLVGDFHLAEDAAQEAFIEAYLDLNKLQEPAAVWKPILQVKVSDVNVELSPVNLLADTRTTDPEEKVIRLLLEVKAAGLEGLILSMSYPVSMLEVALPRFKVQS